MMDTLSYLSYRTFNSNTKMLDVYQYNYIIGLFNKLFYKMIWNYAGPWTFIPYGLMDGDPSIVHDGAKKNP